MPDYPYRCTQPTCTHHNEIVIMTHGMSETPLLSCPDCGHWLQKAPQSVSVLKASPAPNQTDSNPKDTGHQCQSSACCFNHVDDWFTSSANPH